MLIKNVEEIIDFETIKAMPMPSDVMMVNPKYFTVEYAINPHMLDESGNIHKVDEELAKSQWQELKSSYEQIGLKVHQVAGVESLPDMVFSANTSFPYLDANGKKHVVASQMHSKFRKAEVEHIMKWYQKNDYQIHHLNNDLDFEANGDALLHSKWILGGYGFRTSLEIYNELSELTKLPVIALELISDKFYHLDTCLSIIDHETIAIVKEGFAPHSLKLLETLYKNIIYIDYREAIDSFAANCHCPDSKNVFLHDKCPVFKKKLEDHGLRVHGLNTSEYMKSGGSVFCMKMMVY